MTAHSNELAGVSYLAGHKDVQTTSRYVHPPFEAGKRVNDARLRDTVWDTSEFYEEGEIANSLKLLADAKGFEPPTSASGDQCASHFSQGFPGFPDSDECAVARESVRFCASVGLVIPPQIVQLAWGVLGDSGATEREVKLARWVLLSTLTQSGEG
jgi:hypothetical protein